ncbi:hypothetical protein EV714DRAFT_277935 [Schizophyllum commune]
MYHVKCLTIILKPASSSLPLRITLRSRQQRLSRDCAKPQTTPHRHVDLEFHPELNRHPSNMVKSDRPSRKSARSAGKQSASKTPDQSKKEAEAAKRALREMYKKVPHSTFGHGVASNVLVHATGGIPSFGIRSPVPTALKKQPKRAKDTLAQLEEEAARAVDKLYAYARRLVEGTPPSSPRSDQEMDDPGEGSSGAGPSQSVGGQRVTTPADASAQASAHESEKAPSSSAPSPAAEDIPTEIEEEEGPSGS